MISQDSKVAGYYTIQHIRDGIVIDEWTQPNIIVKGGDYNKQNVVGYEFEKMGLLEVKIFKYIENNSTSLIVERIKNDLCIWFR